MGIAMTQIQEMMRELNIEELMVNISILSPITKHKFHSTTNCIIPVCVSSKLDRLKKRSPGVFKQNQFLTKKLFCPGVNMSPVILYL